jgi:hypothetical protein
MLKVALAPLKATAEAPPRLVPLIVTLVPTGPVAGDKLAMVGGLGGVTTVKDPELVAEPPGVVTLTGPLDAPDGTAAWIELSEATVKLEASPLKVTADAPLKPDPLMVTFVPGVPLVGVNPVITGAATTVNGVALVAEPLGVVTLTGPVVAPAGTVA